MACIRKRVHHNREVQGQHADLHTLSRHILLCSPFHSSIPRMPRQQRVHGAVYYRHRRNTSRSRVRCGKTAGGFFSRHAISGEVHKPPALVQVHGIHLHFAMGRGMQCSCGRAPIRSIQGTACGKGGDVSDTDPWPIGATECCGSKGSVEVKSAKSIM